MHTYVEAAYLGVLFAGEVVVALPLARLRNFEEETEAFLLRFDAALAKFGAKPTSKRRRCSRQTRGPIHGNRRKGRGHGRRRVVVAAAEEETEVNP